MPTPDRKAGIREEEGIQFEDTQDTVAPGEMRYHDGVFKLRDSLGEYDPRAGGGITEGTHQTLRQLIHLADGVGGPMEGFASGAYRETLPVADPFPTSITWWESNAKLKKIVEKLITWTGAFPTTIQWKAYDTDGTTVLATVTDAITYSGPFETSRTRTIA